MTKTTETAKTTTFTTLLRNYETATRNRTPETETAYTTALTDLASACVFSVLKKLCNVGGYVENGNKPITDTAKTIRKLRQAVKSDLANLDRLTYAVNNATTLAYNKDGDLETAILDDDLNNVVYAILADLADNDGLDLVNTAIMTILAETDKVTDLNGEFMETPHTIRTLKRKVWIKDSNSVGGYEDKETTPIQEVYRAIRREIQSNRAIQTASHKYTYIADTFKDTETDTETEIFHRLPKYSGLASETVNLNGKTTAITADLASMQDTDRLVAKMNLTAKQAKVLSLRMRGYGQKAIATYTGVSKQAIQKTLKQLQAKATVIGLTIEK